MLNERLRLLCKRRGLTQKQLADEIHVSRSAVAKWINGRGIPCKESIEELCKYFGVKEEWLFGTEDLRMAMEAYEHAVRRVQGSFDAAFSVWNTVLLFLRIACSVAAVFRGIASPTFWLLPVAAMWDAGAAVHLLYDLWAVWWHFLTLRGLQGGKALHFLCGFGAVLLGTTCGLSLYAIATFFMYPPVGDKSGACRIREALYRLGAALARATFR